MRAWGEEMMKQRKNKEGDALFIATDADAPYQMGLGIDRQFNRGLGYIFQRSTITLKNGVVQCINVESDPETVSVTEKNRVFKQLSTFSVGK